VPVPASRVEFLDAQARVEFLDAQDPEAIAKVPGCYSVAPNQSWIGSAYYVIGPIRGSSTPHGTSITRHIKTCSFPFQLSSADKLLPSDSRSARIHCFQIENESIKASTHPTRP
jgi:hypothetical protein